MITRCTDRPADRWVDWWREEGERENVAALLNALNDRIKNMAVTWPQLKSSRNAYWKATGGFCLSRGGNILRYVDGSPVNIYARTACLRARPVKIHEHVDMSGSAHNYLTHAHSTLLAQLQSAEWKSDAVYRKEIVYWEKLNFQKSEGFLSDVEF